MVEGDDTSGPAGTVEELAGADLDTGDEEFGADDAAFWDVELRAWVREPATGFGVPAPTTRAWLPPHAANDTPMTRTVTRTCTPFTRISYPSPENTLP